MPWFIKTLNENTNENIELRICKDQGYSDEDTPLDIIELYLYHDFQITSMNLISYKKYQA